jgi:hypothetical protein
MPKPTATANEVIADLENDRRQRPGLSREEKLRILTSSARFGIEHSHDAAVPSCVALPVQRTLNAARTIRIR